MPKGHVREDGHLKKSVKLDSTSRRNTYYFSDGTDVQRHLQNQDSLTDGEMLSFCAEGKVADRLNRCSPHCTPQPTYHKVW